MSYQNTNIETRRPDSHSGKESRHITHESRMAQFYIFKDEIHLGWDCFDKHTISIGSSEKADLVLKGDGIADIHAVVHLKNDQTVIHSENPAGQIRVNNRNVNTAILGRFDYIDIGPYTIKIKLLKSQKPFSSENVSIDLSEPNDCLPESVCAEADSAADTAAAVPETQAAVSSEDADAVETEEPETSTPPAIAGGSDPEKTIELFYSSGRPEEETDLSDGIDTPEKTIELRDRIDEPEKTIELQMPVASLDREVSDRPATNRRQSGGTDERDEDRDEARSGNGKKFSRKQYYPVQKDAPPDSNPPESEVIPVIENGSGSGPDTREVSADSHLPENAGERYRVVYQGEVADGYTYQEVRENLIRIFGENERHISWIDSETKVVVKKDLSRGEAVKLAKLLEKAGAVVIAENPSASRPKEESEPDQPESKQETRVPVQPVMVRENRVRCTSEEEDEDEEDREAVFSLSDNILNTSPGVQGSGRKKNLEVTKFRHDTIVDVFFLKPGNKYHVRSQDRKFLLAENDRNGNCRFYYSDHVWGTVQSGGSEETSTDHLKKKDKPFRKRDGIYTHTVQLGDTVNVTDGIFKYIIRPVHEEKSPDVALPEQEEKIFHKYMIKSTIVHLFFLVFIGLFHSVRPPEPLPPETHFVKIDRSEISKIVKKKKPVPPPVVKPETPEPAPKPKEIVKKVKPKKPVVATKKKASPRKQVVSRSPKAGGGFGKGNIANRNVNQTGLLSMLGDSVGIKPQTAMAAVTNLDAVPSVAPKSANFKVGGIVGKLGKARIEMPKAGVVSTKGSTQVLRSSGAGGVGTVAALEKGKTGQKQVQGMVSAQLTKAVGIQGGMSREAVKRVIDQHLDEISYCYETALIANPSIMGKVVFEWKILASGKVGMVNIKSSSINSSEIHSCIKAAIRTWQFPKPTGSEVIVSYPFVFDIVGF